MLKKFLNSKDYKVKTVLTGEETLKIVRKKWPDVVLLDIKMPGMDGVQVLQRIKKIDKKLPIVIMITAVKDDDIGKLCMELGASDYITKPIGLDYLENVLVVKLMDVGK